MFRQYYKRPYFLPPMAEATEGNWFIVSSGKNRTLSVSFSLWGVLDYPFITECYETLASSNNMIHFTPSNVLILFVCSMQVSWETSATWIAQVSTENYFFSSKQIYPIRSISGVILIFLSFPAICSGQKFCQIPLDTNWYLQKHLPQNYGETGSRTSL